MNSRRNLLFGFSTLVLGLLGRKMMPLALATEKGGIMLQLRKSAERGMANHGWLKSRHTFSFADYYDPRHMGFGALRVINEDRIDGGTGFGAHPHKDMEIISYVVKGALKHEDSMGTKAVIMPGEVQRMSAGTGVVHSEHNNQPNDETHFFQIWIQPNKTGDKPGYGQKSFETELNTKNLVLVVSNDGRDGSIGINQDADMYISRLKSGQNLDFKIRRGRGLWVQVVKGDLLVGDQVIKTGDAISTREAQQLKFYASEDSEIILFDLA